MKIKAYYTTTKNECWVPVPFEESAAPIQEKETVSVLTAKETERKVIWEGFGGCFNELGKAEIDRLPAQKREEVYEALFSQKADGLRFSYCRVPIGASDYALDWYSLNETKGDYGMEHFSIERDRKYLLPFIEEARMKNPDMRFFASPWSPPTWMKQPPVYNFGRLIETPENLRAYAQYLIKFIQKYREEGIKIGQLHVQNEVTSNQKFPSCLWNERQLRTFIGEYLGPLMEENGEESELWLGTINATGYSECPGSHRYHLYAGPVLGDELAAHYIKGVAYQWEGKYALQPTVDSYPELRYIQSENECGDGENTWEYAKYIFELMRHYIRNGVCAYVYWNMILKKGGESTWGWRQNSLFTVDEQGTLYYEYEYFIIKHAARYVQPGAEVMKLSGHMSANGICFQNQDGSVVLVLQNPYPCQKVVSFKERKFILGPDSMNTIVFE